jgi:hypothetical protein
VVSERLHLCEDGQVLWRLPRPWRDGTTHVRFDPCDFLGRLAVLVPRPRVNLLFNHGVLGARSAWRRAIVPGPAAEGGEASAAVSEPPTDAAFTLRRRQWADLMRRSFPSPPRLRRTRHGAKRDGGWVWCAGVRPGDYVDPTQPG